MVLSFFRKSGVKTSERVQAKPPAVPGGERSGPPVSDARDREEIALSDSGFSEDDWESEFALVSTVPNGGYGVEIQEVTDPFAEIAEQVAILYANGQDDAAQTTLESLISNNSDPGALRLWQMAFDLLRVRGDRKGFETLCLEFARVCELSPPAWGVEVDEKPEGSALPVADTISLQGVVSGDDPLFDALLSALADGKTLSLSLGRLAGLDREGSAKLAKLLFQARRRNLGWILSGAGGLAERLANRTVLGQAQEEPLWLLLLELYQYLGWEEPFEEKAVDYAVTFEVSPPSWEKPQFSEIQLAMMASDAQETRVEPVEQLAGELLQGDLKTLPEHIKKGVECRVDFSGVTRMDFASAGALVNLLAASGAASVIIQYPNRLVAELMRVMGIDQLAQIELSKY